MGPLSFSYSLAIGEAEVEHSFLLLASRRLIALGELLMLEKKGRDFQRDEQTCREGLSSTGQMNLLGTSKGAMLYLQGKEICKDIQTCRKASVIPMHKYII